MITLGQSACIALLAVTAIGVLLIPAPDWTLQGGAGVLGVSWMFNVLCAYFVGARGLEMWFWPLFLWRP